MINKRERWHTWASVALSALLTFVATGCPGGTGKINLGGGGGETKSGCCSEGPPSGYVKTDSSWSPTTCGSPTDSNVKNACTYQNYSDKPVGAIMDICNDQAIPAGWEPAPNASTGPDGTFWSPTKCGSPPSTAPNMLKIKRSS